MIQIVKANNHMSTQTHAPKVLQGKTILIVEDDHFISKVYAKWLAVSGAHVEVAHDGVLGLRLLEEKKVDLIMLDLGMPGLNGYEMLTEIKKNEHTKAIPVIVLSNTTMSENKVGFDEIRNAGVSDILRKYETSLSEIVKCISSYFPDESVAITHV